MSIQINLNNIVASDTFYLTRVVAQQILNKGYANVGLFFKNIPVSDLDTLQDKIVAVESEILTQESKQRRTSELILLALTLALGEGKLMFEREEIPETMKRLRIFCFAASLDKAGDIKAEYDKFSFSDDLNFPLYTTVDKENS